MPGTNDYKAFAGGVGANTLTPAAYALLTALISQGFQTGVASSQQVNTVLRQSTTIAAAIATLIAASGINAVDNGDAAANAYNVALATNPGIQYGALCTGTADALIAALPTPPVTLVDGYTVIVEAAAANATSTPTFTPNGTLPIAPKQIVKGNNLPLQLTDIPGAQSRILLVYDLSLDKWVLLNPARGVSASSPQIAPLPAPTVASNALTIPSAFYSLDFRNATLATGGATNVQGTPAALVVTAGATLGMTNNKVARIAVVVLNNGGVLEYAVNNWAGGNDLSETGVISTTAMSAVANAANVFYSQTARVNLPYRLVGYFDIVQVTAGQWITLASLVQGAGGQAGLLPHSWLRLSILNGYGSASNKIARWLNIVQNTGDDWTYTDSATLGGSITILRPGTFTFTGTLVLNAAGEAGLSLNTANPTVAIGSLPANEILSYDNSAGYIKVNFMGPLQTGDVVRVHTGGAALNGSFIASLLNVARIG